MLLCAAMLAAGAVAELVGPRQYTGGLPLLAAASLMAGALLSFRQALGFFVAACLLSLGIDLYVGRSTGTIIVGLSDIVIIGTMALVVNSLLHRQRQRLVRALSVAEAAQRAILPDPPDTVGPLRVAAGYAAAMAEARIGGDLYAVQRTPFGVRALIGDVRGKGLQAVGTVSVIIGAFREEAEHTAALVDLADRLDAALHRENEYRAAPSAPEQFTTALLAEFSADGSTVHLLNRGHPSPLLVHEGTVTRLDPGTRQLPLGTGLPTPGDEPATVDTVRVPPGAFLVLITDGLVEARDARGRYYDPARGVLASSRVFRDPAEVVEALMADVQKWTDGRRRDDMAAVALTPVTGATRTPRPAARHRRRPHTGSQDAARGRG